MITSRDEQNGVIICGYESSTIYSSEYNTVSKDLIVTFKTGKRYRYKNVKITDYTRFETADSQGKVLNSHIKQYVTEQIKDTVINHNNLGDIQGGDDCIVNIKDYVDFINSISYGDITKNNLISIMEKTIKLMKEVI